MTRHEFYKSNWKAIAGLVSPVLIGILLLVIQLNDPTFFDTIMAWFWVALIVFLISISIKDLRQRTPEVVLDERGIAFNDGLCFWSSISELVLMERFIGAKKFHALVLETRSHRKHQLDITALQGSPKEIFEIVNQFWTEYRDQVPVESTASPLPEPVPATAIADHPGPRCPNCGNPVSLDDWECAECFERLA